MRVRLALVTSLMVAGLLILQVTGCKQQAPEETAQVPPDEHAAPPAPDAPGADTAMEASPSASAQSAAVSESSIDPNKRYDDQDMETLSFIILHGKPEQATKALNLMKAMLAKSNIPDVRRSVASSLGIVADKAVTALGEAARHDKDTGVRQAALEALGAASPTPKLIATLESLRHASDATMRARAFTTLVNVQFNQKDKTPAYRWAAAQLGTNKDDVSAQIMMKLQQEGAGALPACIKTLQTSPDANARQAAACVIGLVCAGTNPRQQEFAKLSKATQKEETRKPGPANLDGLAPLEKAAASDPSAAVRAVAAQGLGYLGQASSAPILGKLLRDDNEEVRWWAATALITIPADVVATDLASTATTDSSSRVRRAAVRAMGWLKSGPVVTDAMIEATHDSSAEVRRAAAVQLGRIGDPVALSALSALFDDGDEDVRWAAVVAMGALKDPAAAPLLAAVVADPNPMVANAAETALQKMGIASRRYGTRGEG